MFTFSESTRKLETMNFRIREYTQGFGVEHKSERKESVNKWVNTCFESGKGDQNFESYELAEEAIIDIIKLKLRAGFVSYVKVCKEIILSERQDT